MSNSIEELRESIINSPYGNKLGFRLLELSKGYAKISVKLNPEYSNFLGVIDGGLVMSLADCAFGCSVNTFGQVRVAAQFSTNFIAAPAIDSELIAVGKTVHAGKTLALTEITVIENGGRLIAKATGTAITKPK